jgi:hypothetical protein
VDVSNLEVGESIHIRDVRLPKACSVDTSNNYPVVSVILPKRGKEGEEEVEAVIEEKAEEKAE